MKTAFASLSAYIKTDRGFRFYIEFPRIYVFFVTITSSADYSGSYE